ncbi:hypothetical protein DFS34DRAFT_657540 [Phlyctochytrium arcticum]|nr:hypothetical protein DFS34DRAFT_657540 [Phlyctochytrium arcticum]
MLDNWELGHLEHLKVETFQHILANDKPAGRPRSRNRVEVPGTLHSSGSRGLLSCLPRELFLLVLDHTPIYTLLRTRGVCRSWYLDVIHAVSIRLNSSHRSSGENPITALISTDGELYQEKLQEADLTCIGVKGLEAPWVENWWVTGETDRIDTANVRLVFGPKSDQDQWPVRGYFVNSEGRIDIAINNLFKARISNSSFQSTELVQEGDDWTMTCVVKERPEIEPGSSEAKGLPEWWITAGQIWGMPSEVYYCDVELKRLEISVGWLMRVTKAQLKHLAHKGSK